MPRQRGLPSLPYSVVVLTPLLERAAAKDSQFCSEARAQVRPKRVAAEYETGPRMKTSKTFLVGAVKSPIETVVLSDLNNRMP